MSNLSDLMNAGIISAGATFSTDELNIINSLTGVEVAALISIWPKVHGTSLINSNCNASPISGSSKNSIGIVF